MMESCSTTDNVPDGCENTCKFCYCPLTEEEAKFKPCQCRGTNENVHPRWVNFSKKSINNCEEWDQIMAADLSIDDNKYLKRQLLNFKFQKRDVVTSAIIFIICSIIIMTGTFTVSLFICWDPVLAKSHFKFFLLIVLISTVLFAYAMWVWTIIRECLLLIMRKLWRHQLPETDFMSLVP